MIGADATRRCRNAMTLVEPFLKLPVQFDADKLAAEVQALPVSAWLPHPQGFEGNEAVPLVSPGGQATDGFDGAMSPTKHLSASPYIMEVMGELGAVWGRSRLMALAPGSEVPAHVDFHYYWRTHYRVHIPVITNPDVLFTCGETEVHMRPGECWIPNTFLRHFVRNLGTERRIHLVMDTVGGERFWDLMAAARGGESSATSATVAHASELVFEQVNSTPIMSPYELRFHLRFLRDHLVNHPVLPALHHRLDRFIAGWTAAWAHFGPDERGLPFYGDLIRHVHRDVATLCESKVLLDNGKTFIFFFERFLLANAISKELTARLVENSKADLRQAAAR
jgi:hypothetical protein